MEIVDHIIGEFSLQELIKIAECVGMAPVSTWGSRKLVDVMNAKLAKGFPNTAKFKDDVKLLFLDYLYVAGFVDDDGNVSEVEKDADVSIEDAIGSLGISEVPDCFSYADDMDPACRRCPIFKHCAEHRISNLPPCYGHLYEEADPSCVRCMEAVLCRLSKKLLKKNQSNAITNL